MIGRSFHVVDPDHTVRQALSLLLRAMGAEAAGFDHAEAMLDALAAGRVREPDCVISEIRLPGLQGLALLDRLRSERPSVPVILISAWAEIPTVNRAFRAGVLACLEKPWRELDLTEVLAEAVARRDRDLARARALHEAEARLASLTDRERAVFTMMCAGRLNKQIAAELGVAERTVEAHRARVIGKFGVASLPDLVRQAVLLEQHGSVRGAASVCAAA